jgi:hypothetical protein
VRDIWNGNKQGRFPLGSNKQGHQTLEPLQFEAWQQSRPLQQEFQHRRPIGYLKAFAA